MKDKLKNCPFCGAEAFIGDTWDGRKSVICSLCGCNTVYFKNKLEVIERWNRRAEPEKTRTKKNKQERQPGGE